MTHAQTLRLIWIDAFVAQGNVLLNRKHLELTFGISTPQASNDLKKFMCLFPGRLSYSLSGKGYYANQVMPAFNPVIRQHVLLVCDSVRRASKQLTASKKAYDVRL